MTELEKLQKKVEALQEEVETFYNVLEWNRNFEDFIEIEHRDLYFKACKYADENTDKVKVYFYPNH